MEKVFKYDNLNVKDIEYYDFELYGDKNCEISRIWLKNNSNLLQSLYVQFPYLTISNYFYDNHTLELDITKEIEGFFEKLDESSVSFISESSISNKYDIESYRTIIKEDTINNKLRLKILTDKKPTLFYLNKNKQPLQYSEAINYLKHKNKIKIIIEINSIIYDITNNFVYTNILLRQVLICAHKPISFELNDYSFVDSDIGSDISSEKSDDSNIILNQYTEYIENNINNTDSDMDNDNDNYDSD